MEITAKFDSYCPICETPIKTGETCEWEKGQKARHVKCPEIPGELKLQYQLSNGQWSDCNHRTDEFIGRCAENQQKIDGQWISLSIDEVKKHLLNGFELRNAPNDWYSVCRCKNAHDRKMRKRRSVQPHKTTIEKQGQLWESCKCGNEPVYLPLLLCSKCWPSK